MLDRECNFKVID
jgi:serine/threonine protein kinase